MEGTGTSISLILQGDVLDGLAQLPDESVQCVVTSPPYWGLRDYGVAGQLGLERTPDEYVARMVAVFAEVRRVLRADGTLWLNIGDSYNAGTSAKRKAPTTGVDVGGWNDAEIDGGARINFVGLKPKDLCMMPARLAMGLQAAGWYLRSDIIWSKPNPMPESVTDRPTKAHEYLFLLSKSAKYFYDHEAIKEDSVTGDPRRPYGSEDGREMDGRPKEQQHGGKPRGRASGNKSHKAVTEYDASDSEEHRTKANLLLIAGTAYEKRNKRSVWHIAPKPFKGAHFATFPPALVEPCILAGSRPGDIILDPFGGSMTTGCVALQHGRDFYGIELSAPYVELGRARLLKETGVEPIIQEV